MAEHLGFVGVGRMGGPMAGRLIDAGHALTVFDVSDAATAPLMSKVSPGTGRPKFSSSIPPATAA